MFNLLINIAILVNAIVIGLETEFACSKSSEACLPSEQFVWKVFEWFFLTLFLFEAILKNIHLTVRGYFADDWNKFDFFLLTFAIVDVWILAALNTGGNFKPAIALRVLRAFRLVRLVKLMRSFKELYLIVTGMVEAFKTLLWVGGLLIFVLYIFAICMTIMIGQGDSTAIRYNGAWTQSDYWGSVPRSMFTLFQIITTDSWGTEISLPIVSVQKERGLVTCKL